MSTVLVRREVRPSDEQLSEPSEHGFNFASLITAALQIGKSSRHDADAHRIKGFRRCLSHDGRQQRHRDHGTLGLLVPIEIDAIVSLPKPARSPLESFLRIGRRTTQFTRRTTSRPLESRQANSIDGFRRVDGWVDVWHADQNPDKAARRKTRLGEPKSGQAKI